MSPLSIVLTLLVITPFALLAMALTRDRLTRERLLFRAIRQIRSPKPGESRARGVLQFVLFYGFMFLAIVIGQHI
jgi:hypothetical protein